MGLIALYLALFVLLWAWAHIRAKHARIELLLYNWDDTYTRLWSARSAHRLAVDANKRLSYLLAREAPHLLSE